jgi:hypothetical protein
MPGFINLVAMEFLKSDELTIAIVQISSGD